VAELLVEAGEFVGAGSPVARVLGLDAQLASFSVPPEDVAALEAAGRITVEHAGRAWTRPSRARSAPPSSLAS
jgi:hypothetical protein